jgi:TorA maturation chaperone TorD
MNYDLDDDVLRRKLRAFLWRWASTLFHYPDPEIRAQIEEAPTWDAAERFSRELRYDDVAAALGRARRALARQSQVSLEAFHSAAFGHTVRSQAPPYETEWGAGEGLLQPQWIADVAGFYRAHGLRLAPGGERADHVTIECEFLQFLLLKEARAAERGERDHAKLCADGCRAFLGEHVARFVPAFASRLRANGAAGPYQQFAEVLDALVRAECAAAGIPRGEDALAQRIATEEDRECMSCPLHAPAETPT